MSDLISRQAAIEALKREEALTRAFGHHVVIDTIRELPTAQPEIIRCKDCKYAHLTNDGKSCKYCDQFTDDYGQVMEMYFDSDFYCGDAERRTDG